MIVTKSSLQHPERGTAITNLEVRTLANGASLPTHQTYQPAEKGITAKTPNLKANAQIMNVKKPNALSSYIQLHNKSELPLSGSTNRYLEVFSDYSTCENKLDNPNRMCSLEFKNNLETSTSAEARQLNIVAGETSWCRKKSGWRDSFISNSQCRMQYSRYDASVPQKISDDEYNFRTVLSSKACNAVHLTSEDTVTEPCTDTISGVSSRTPFVTSFISNTKRQTFNLSRDCENPLNEFMCGLNNLCTKSTSSNRFSAVRSLYFLLTLTSLLILFLPGRTGALTGPNVCTKQETYTSLVNVSVVKAYRVRSYTFCLSIPPKCSKYKINYKTVYKTQSQVKKRTVEVCCNGYTRVSSEDRCIPVCSNPCIHGVCVKPDQCGCTAGYSGPTCNITTADTTVNSLYESTQCSDPQRCHSCPEGKWGMGCVYDCPCRHEGKCDPLYGNCSCHAGWIGQYCEERCPEQSYGMDCKEQCRCQNGGTCDHISGACHCPPGWTGPLCEKMCPDGTHGDACSNKCQCQNGGSCDPFNGKCRCPPGWTGDVCANPCPLGTWGHNCSEQCDCYSGATCDHVTGRCKCTAGFQGNKCQKECPLGTYGVNCTEQCSCDNGATCSHISGRCFCQKGWLGATCDQSACPPNQYGESCSKRCTCDAENTERCHPWTGECECKPGWAGVTCSRACPFYKYGEKCSKTCKCMNGAFCNSIDGSCTCAPGYHGPLCEHPCPAGRYGQNCKLECRCTKGIGCNHETGKCVCQPGWEGLQCMVTCPDGKYGPNCTQQCDCEYGGACNPETGECTCGPGHFGEHCERTCEQGYHGTDCKSHCACVGPNVEGCDPETGRCICKPGYRGVSCDSRCPRGFYGESCTKQCDCKNNGSCDPQTGKCTCERGWNGADCNTPCRKHKHGVNCNQDCPTCLHGNGTCEHTTGACVCASGWRGPRCDRTCPENYWGIGCFQKCQCRNGGECRPETGECVCLPGWRGTDCSEPCEHDYFGYNCLQPCHCRNHASCRGNDGFCECLPGWMGPGCTQTCPEGYFGRQCLNVCNCSNDRFICYPVDGCRCKNGFEGDDCDQPIMSTIVDVNLEALPPSGRGSSHSAGVIVGVVFIIVCTIIVSVVLYYRRRVKSLKRELAVVQYTANPGGSGQCLYSAEPVQCRYTAVPVQKRQGKISRQPSLKEPPAPPPPPVAAAKARAARLSLKTSSTDRPEGVENSRMSDQHHFDNPVYAYQPVSKSQPNLNENGAAGGSLNTIHNNLHHNHHKDTNNRHWDKLGNFTFDNESTSAVGTQHYDVPGSSSSINRKAWEADATNPNLYHSIENLKDNRIVEHVYDEIKQKTPPHQREPDGEYDRLTYSRPVGEVKPHYYRMPSSLLTHRDHPPVPTTPNTTQLLLTTPHPLPLTPETTNSSSTTTCITITSTSSSNTSSIPATMRRDPLVTTTTNSTPFNITTTPLLLPQTSFPTNISPLPQISSTTLQPTTLTDQLLTSTSSATSTITTSTTTTNMLTTSSTVSLSNSTSTAEAQERCSLTPSIDSSSETSNMLPSDPSSPASKEIFPSHSDRILKDLPNSEKFSSKPVKLNNISTSGYDETDAAARLNNLNLSVDGTATMTKKAAYSCNKLGDSAFEDKNDDNSVGLLPVINPFNDKLEQSYPASSDALKSHDCDDNEDLLPALETETDEMNVLSEKETDTLRICFA